MNLTNIILKPRALNFVNSLNKELGFKNDPARTLQFLKGVLSAIRDSLTFEQAIEVQTKLPVFLKPLFSDGWKPMDHDKKKTHDFQFLAFNYLNKENGIELIEGSKVKFILEIILKAIFKEIQDSSFLKSKLNYEDIDKLFHNQLFGNEVCER